MYKFDVKEQPVVPKSSKTMWVVSGIFFAAAVVGTILVYTFLNHSHASYYEQVKFMILILLMMAAVYT
ncbi:MAG: hypothetical protein K2N60_06925, partial [Oscillospiraceae bacterium]|nr:hypothetical protein [Oscillospiraceae bacterium]